MIRNKGKRMGGSHYLGSVGIAETCSTVEGRRFSAA
jgi:hypothetical protein